MKEKIKNIFGILFMMSPNDIPDDVEQGKFEKWDSLQQLNLIVTLEEQFNVEFTPEEIADMTTIPKIIKYINEKNNLF